MNIFLSFLMNSHVYGEMTILISNLKNLNFSPRCLQIPLNGGTNVSKWTPMWREVGFQFCNQA